MTRETGINAVGLCHGFYGYRQLCMAIGVPADEVQWEAPGVNHWIYLTQFRHQGQDLYPRIDEWIESRAAEYWRTFRGRFSDTQLSRAAIDHYQRVGLMPIGDASRTFSEWYYQVDFETKREWFGHLGGFDSEIGWAHYLEKERLAFKTGDRELLVSSVLDDHRSRSLEQAEAVIDSILALPWNQSLADRFGGSRRKSPLPPYELPAR